MFRFFIDNGSNMVAAFKAINNNEDDISESDVDESDTDSVILGIISRSRIRRWDGYNERGG